MKTAAADPRRVLNLCLLAVATAGLVAYLAARGVGRTDWAAWLPLAGTLPVLAAVLVDSLMSLLRRKIGLDLIALISIGGAIMLGEYVATAVIAIMLSGGRVLEDYAAGRVSREMSALLARVPRSASRSQDGTLKTVSLDVIAAGDRLLVRTGCASRWIGQYRDSDPR